MEGGRWHLSRTAQRSSEVSSPRVPGNGLVKCPLFRKIAGKLKAGLEQFLPVTAGFVGEMKRV